VYRRQQDPAVALVALVAGEVQYGPGILTEYGVIIGSHLSEPTITYIQQNMNGGRTGKLQ
jgi:hypothetical protein